MSDDRTMLPPHSDLTEEQVREALEIREPLRAAMSALRAHFTQMPVTTHASIERELVRAVHQTVATGDLTTIDDFAARLVIARNVYANPRLEKMREDAEVELRSDSAPLHATAEEIELAFGR